MTLRPSLIGFLRALCLTLLGVGLATSATGCVREPTMQLYSGGIRGVSPQGALLQITMKVRNDNSFDVLVRNVTTDVTLANRHRLPTVNFSPNVWLPADKTTLVSVPVLIPYNQIAPILATTALSPVVTYHAEGRADVTATRALEIDVNEYALSDEGAFSRLELLQAAGRGL